MKGASQTWAQRPFLDVSFLRAEHSEFAAGFGHQVLFFKQRTSKSTPSFTLWKDICSQGGKREMNIKYKMPALWLAPKFTPDSLEGQDADGIEKCDECKIRNSF